MGKLKGKVAVITGGSSGMALASAKLFVEEGAHVFITGRRQEVLDQAVASIGRNVIGVQGDAANLDDLDRLFETVKREQGKIDVLFASAGAGGEAQEIGAITEKNFDALFGLNTRGTLFTVQKALPLLNDGGSIIMTGSIASVKGWPNYSAYAGSKAALRAFARAWLNELKERQIRVNLLSPGQIATPIQEKMFDEATKRQFRVFDPTREDGPSRGDRDGGAVSGIRRLQLCEWRRVIRRWGHLRDLAAGERVGFKIGKLDHDESRSNSFILRARKRYMPAGL